MRTTAPLATITLAVLGALVAASCSGGEPDPYTPLHQEARQEIPGTFGYDLLPVEGFATGVDPAEAWRELPGAGRGADVSVTLAEVQNASQGVDWGPSWVFFTNDLCYFTAKGDFVSPARSGNDDGCTPQNVLVQVVDATSGEFRAVFEAYDADLSWLPRRVGSPDQVPGATRFQ
ncbi:MAG: hypothetical protein ACRDGK_00170 [Actinomycetota bacterium]